MWTLEALIESLIAVAIVALLFALLVVANRDPEPSKKTGASKKKYNKVRPKKPQF